MAQGLNALATTFAFFCSIGFHLVQDCFMESRRARGSFLDETTGSPYAPRDACGVGFIARQSGERTHEVVTLALEAAARLAHRGAAATDLSADGAGLLTQIPRRLFILIASRLGIHLPADAAIGVGMCFLPTEPMANAQARALVTDVLLADGIPVLGWRDVPVRPEVLGASARVSMPAVAQILVGRPAGSDDDNWERRLYLARRETEHRAHARGLDPFYLCSLSCRTVVYKGLLTGGQLGDFFPDLRDPAFESAIAVFHERYATNTMPRWELAQPFRLLAHNGEINTLWGNRNAMGMRGGLLDAPAFGEMAARVREPIRPKGSDSASLDNALELLVRAGRSPVHATMMLVPQAWEKYPDVEPAVKAFYEYHQCVIEPWDGPAALAYSDGLQVAVSLDRNGLRPCRYKIRADGMVVAGSEVGIVDFDPRDVVETGKLGPGGVFLVDTVGQRIVRNLAAKREVATRRPYAKWIAQHMATLPTTDGSEPLVRSSEQLRATQTAFGYGHEDLRLVLDPMATSAAEVVWSMGDDAPLAVLSPSTPPLYSFFRQRFAQVTNPPMDSLRESMVMSLRMHLGRRGSPLVERPAYARMLRIEHPVLLPDEMAALRAFPQVPSATLDATYAAKSRPEALEAALDSLCRRAEVAARKGARLLIISDRKTNADRAPIPALLALGAVRQHLVRTGLRARVGLVVEAGDAIEQHHMAALFGYGAEAVHPWLAMETVATLFTEAHGKADADTERPGPAQAQSRYRTAVEKGLLKVLAKMGISTLSSYCGAQTFDAIGLGADVIDRCFAGTASPIGGLTLREVSEDVLSRHRRAFAPDGAPATGLTDHGRVRFRKDGEQHAWAPTTVLSLQQAVGSARSTRAGSNPDDAWRTFASRADGGAASTVRDLLSLRPGQAIALDEVEPMERIRARFISSAMSLGALSPEAHETLTVAMNRMQARSNSGEGGEEPAHYGTHGDDRRDSRIKQVASARFGVTTSYLMHAEEIEIKIVQGAKPGEGGQLPGHKVTELIARLRHSTPGVGLISPPPHHDIYSIEDLAQLVHDLKSVNPAARVGVKLVAASGVGTVAAGVAKAFADYVLIAGHNGGTGASPLSSIKHAGSPWELGLAEAQQVLVANGLRHRVELRVDGGLRTARDVIVAAALGAESYGFGTAPLVAMGCDMARQCHLNTCPTGIATQREDLRAKFRGTPEQVIAYFTRLADDVRTELALLGVRALDDIIGQVERLQRAERPELPRSTMLDLSLVLAAPRRQDEARQRTVERNVRPGAHDADAALLAELAPSLETGTPVHLVREIRNHHLTVGARVAGAIAAKHGPRGLPTDTVRLDFTGSAGQSFGAFAVRGMRLTLEGEANDYVGKGLSGGEITVRPFRNARYRGASHLNMIVGNTVLYGATDGILCASGQAGDRFAVRNSGACAVVEGVGNHACEYMTGGVVVVLGRAGRNFGAGMSNGLAFVFDESDTFASRLNHEMVLMADPDEEDSRLLSQLLALHWLRTGSPRARWMLDDWDRQHQRWRKVKPRGAVEHAARIRTHWSARVASLLEPSEAVVSPARPAPAPESTHLGRP
jgi:glutamate synthase domain-containing protein 2/glutamate synthase domain-containing protein 1/glutamate synthase domain-containing protein 3